MASPNLLSSIHIRFVLGRFRSSTCLAFASSLRSRTILLARWPSYPCRPKRWTPATGTRCRRSASVRPLITYKRIRRFRHSLPSSRRSERLRGFTLCGRLRNGVRVPSKSRKSATHSVDRIFSATLFQCLNRWVDPPPWSATGFHLQISGATLRERAAGFLGCFTGTPGLLLFLSALNPIRGEQIYERVLTGSGRSRRICDSSSIRLPAQR